MKKPSQKAPFGILIVDDEKDLVDLVAYNLEREGYAVLKAYDGEEALDIIRSRKPDLVLLDLMLPGIQGLEICRIVRSTPKQRLFPSSCSPPGARRRTRSSVSKWVPTTTSPSPSVSGNSWPG